MGGKFVHDMNMERSAMAVILYILLVMAFAALDRFIDLAQICYFFLQAVCNCSSPERS